MKEAILYERQGDTKVKCGLCAHRCIISEGRRGICGVRQNDKGTLYSLVYCKLVSENPDPVEKKPLFHYLPGSRTYSISTVGCNFRCRHCQNWRISQYPRLSEGEMPGQQTTPEAIVTNALATGCASISYTYVEPTVFMETALETGRLARAAGLGNIFVTNGYETAECRKLLAQFLDAANVDLKAFSDRFYKEVCGARLEPVLETIEDLHSMGIWVEVTTLVIPGWNDTEEELRQIARFIAGISPTIPWHVTAFHPTFEMLDRPPTPIETLERARRIGLEEGLEFVYQGNVPGAGGENTYCPGCGKELIRRRGFMLETNLLGREGRCPGCGRHIAGMWGSESRPQLS